MSLLFCKNCDKEVEFKMEPIKMHLKANCSHCGKFIKFIAHISDEEFIMPFGKHKGTPLVQAIIKDRQYFEWFLTTTFSRGLRERIQSAINKLNGTKNGGLTIN